MYQSIHELSLAIQQKKVSITDIVDSYLKRIQQFNGRINALITVDHEQALQQARAYDEQLTRAKPEELPPLFGLPIIHKDIFCTKTY